MTAIKFKSYKDGPSAHCWEDGPTQPDGVGMTCMLPNGHRGKHEWTRDDKIKVSFGKTPGIAAPDLTQEEKP